MSRRWLRATAASATLFAGLFVAAAALSPSPRLIWNASPSVPIGFYTVDPGRRPDVGELALIAPPPDVAALLAARGYVPRGVPLLKRVAAKPGTLVCRSGVFITIDGAPAARARDADRLGRPLPQWLGCRRLQPGQLFLLNAAPDSLDGRYFGPISDTGLIGTARPLATRDALGTPLRWRRAPLPASPFPTAKDISS
ncbi:MAG: S26 family signal peptidase [Sphingopyxis sp.]|uniref:S26 family signal peptidase n=1 Tax=Sphingopyxis sp. TaxID=1908224 RepID=UPI002ABB9CF1|nr:S26 family signal peptidase [Sphingopyxis sp.]MDZ3831914.1 S26 family signal peptidase [Sphingopyxis sp.]